MTTYRIAEVAERTGFSAPTLRYYEEIGVVPPAPRSDAGYRVYDDRAIERLAFVARAKRLGCTLEEITDLAVAWDQDECAPVQHRLRSLVTDKLAQTEAQIADLGAFAASLRSTSAVLDAAPLDGPCGDDCGCVADAAPVAIACTLGADEMDQRIDDWRSLLDGVDRVPIPGGLRLSFPAPAPLPALVRLVEAEQGCCSFFSFAITVDDR
ncbi:MAG TPA: MerR family transcriptional regulator, partial [Acidimicrobiales bacterium]|nr:MerR family transcriptional regulator [Acidimicrobiales bacterium]